MTRIYLDHAATTPLLPEVHEAMEPWLAGGFGNPSSLHEEGRRAKDAIDESREILSSALGCLFAEVLFTSSGTEAANLAIIGAALANTDPQRNRILLGAAEHHCVLRTRPLLERLGYAVDLIPVDRIARIRLDKFEQMLGPNVLLASVMHANNELGTIQPITEIASLIHNQGALFHCDAVQTLAEIIRPPLPLREGPVNPSRARGNWGRVLPLETRGNDPLTPSPPHPITPSSPIPLPLREGPVNPSRARGNWGRVLPLETRGNDPFPPSLPLHSSPSSPQPISPSARQGPDLMTFSAHKLYGPKGAGAIYVKAGTALKPLTVGGGQEREMRAGTENVAAIVGFAAAVRAATNAPLAHSPSPRELFLDQLLAAGFVATMPDRADTLLGHAHVRLPGVDAETMLIRLDRAGISASSGAACSSGSLEPSHVLLACGYSEREAKEGLRFTFGRFSTADEAHEAANRVIKAANAIN